MHRLKLVKELKVWLLGIAAGLMAIHLNLTWKSGNTDLLGSSVLFWIAVSSLLWKKRNTFTLVSDVFSSFFGASLISLVLLKSASLYGRDFFLYISPLISGLGLGLLASGMTGLKQYWQELVILCVLAIPPQLPSLLIDVPYLTAKFASYTLWYLGFPVSRQGANVILSQGSVHVDPGCSGVTVMLQLLGLAFIFLVMFPTNLSQKIFVPVVAILIGFVVNGVRVALMVFLVTFSHPEAFVYWHVGDGSLIFSLIAVMIFGFFCRFLLLWDEPGSQNSIEV